VGNIITGALGSQATHIDASTYTTSAAYTPSAWSQVVVTILSAKATLPDIPTFTGNGITYSLLTTQTFGTIASPLKRLSVLAGTAASPTLEVGTADFGGATQIGCNIEVREFGSMNTTSGFTNLYSTANNSANGLAASLATLSVVSSGVFAAVAQTGSSANDVVADSGYTLFADRFSPTPAMHVGTLWSSSASTAPGGTWGGSGVGCGIIAFELVAQTSSSAGVVALSTSQRATRRRRR
jgi:hypothetical protein